MKFSKGRLKHLLLNFIFSYETPLGMLAACFVTYAISISTFMGHFQKALSANLASMCTTLLELTFIGLILTFTVRFSSRFKLVNIAYIVLLVTLSVTVIYLFRNVYTEFELLDPDLTKARTAYAIVDCTTVVAVLYLVLLYIMKLTGKIKPKLGVDIS